MFLKGLFDYPVRPLKDVTLSLYKGKNCDRFIPKMRILSISLTDNGFKKRPNFIVRVLYVE